MTNWVRLEPMDRERVALRIGGQARTTFAPVAAFGLELEAACVALAGAGSPQRVLVTFDEPLDADAERAADAGGTDASAAPAPRFDEHETLRAFGGRADARPAAEAIARGLAALANLGAPTIAVVTGTIDGLAAAASLQCDVRVFARGARFASSSSERALSPPPGVVARLVALVGRDIAEALLVEAARLDATRALDAGLAHVVTDDEPLRAAAALELARLRTAQRRDPRGARAILADLAGAARLRLHRAAPARPELERATALAAELVQRTARGHDVRALEIDALAELALSGAARRLAAHHQHAHTLLPEAAKQEAEAMQTAMVLEALALVDAGASARDVDRAARLFGFASPPLASLEHAGRDVLALRVERLRRARGDRFDVATPTRTVRPRRHVLEELQQRMALRFVNEAFFAREAGLDEVTLDRAAVRHAGFPPFRGGPFEYVDTIGAGEIAARLAHFAREVHPRFTAAPGLAAWTRARPTR